MVLAIRFLLFVTLAYGVRARATFTNGDECACGYRPDKSRSGRVRRTPLRSV